MNRDQPQCRLPTPNAAAPITGANNDDDEDNKEWTVPFLFDVACSIIRDPKLEDIQKSIKTQDLSLFLGGQQPMYRRLYFNLTTYPTTTTTTTTTRQEEGPTTNDEGITGGSRLTNGSDNNRPANLDSSNSSMTLDRIPSSFEALKRDLMVTAFRCGFSLFSNGGSCLIRTRRFKCGGCVNRANSKRNLDLAKNRIRKAKAVIRDKSCPFGMNIRWDHIGFYISIEKRSG